MPTRKPPGNLVLLDTHVWLWLMNGDGRLAGSRSLALIEKAVRLSRIRVSAISVWEVGMLEAKGRIRLPMDCLDWVQMALGAPGISLVPVTPEIAIESSRLPGELHGDPADRILVATARNLGAAFVTHDERIVSYGAQGHADVLPL